MNRRRTTVLLLPILPFWAFVGIFILALTVWVELGLLGIVLGLVELLLVRNGFPPANHSLRFRGELAAVVLVGALFIDYEKNLPEHTGSQGLFILVAVIGILIWSALDAYVLPR